MAWAFLASVGTISLVLFAAAGVYEARVSGLGTIAEGEQRRTGSEKPSPAQSMVDRLDGLELGEGHGLPVLLADLEAHLPQNVRVHRLQYNLSEGTVRLELQSEASDQIAGALNALEGRFGPVRIVERQEDGKGEAQRVWLRVAFNDRIAGR